MYVNKVAITLGEVFSRFVLNIYIYIYIHYNLYIRMFNYIFLVFDFILYLNT